MREIMYKLHLEYTVRAAGILSLKETMTGLHLANIILAFRLEFGIGECSIAVNI